MSRFANIRRPSFGRRPGEDPTPTGRKTICADHRRTVMLKEASALVASLPGPGESTHALMTGRFDLMLVVTALLDQLGPARAIRIATLSFNARNLTEMVRILDDDQAEGLTLLCSAFFRDHNAELWEEASEEFAGHGQKIAAARSHAKVVTLDFASGQKLVMEGSANLRTTSNIEQLAVIHEAGLHDWHAAWIEDFVSKHRSDDAA